MSVKLLKMLFATVEDREKLEEAVVEVWRIAGLAGEPSYREPRAAIDRVAIFERDGWTCQYCGAGVTASDHIDHVIPHSRGGSDDPSNLVAACIRCNLKKGAKTPQEWMKQ